MSKKRDTIKEKGWDLIINHLEKNGLSLKNLVLTSKEIKDITREEPRILCKFDEYEKYPSVLKKKNLFILPIKNRFYQIIEGNGFHFIEPLPKVDPEEFISKLKFDLLTSVHGTSESLYLDIAINSGLIEEFVQSSPLFLTIRGRKYSPKFRMRFSNAELDIESVQVEVDAGFEGKDVIVLIEAKGSKPESFNIRQLYYPFRFWSTHIQDKTIINIFFWHDETHNTYHLCQYDFKDEMDYHSIELEKYKIYKIKQLELEKARDLSNRMIPQADDMNKVIKLVQEVSKGFNDSKQISEKLDFTVRQSSYYRQAAEILQLVHLDKENRYSLTEKGLELLKVPEEKQSELIQQQLLSVPIVKKIVSLIMSKKEQRITFEELIPFVIENTGLSENTARRRIKTLRSWFSWLEKKIGTFETTKDYLKLRTEKIKKFTDFL
ncbi:MAG: AAA-associated domain-containing protein [Candidatus Heimdallarchaeota archaeon]|nr:AAA-associated domain-containing protein [Candidatus Heimdallarchaeota archaeon]MCK4610572.1 AAA-associated domain-containing protein [Candidatus Heimdallarchaeota archaeon]